MDIAIDKDIALPPARHSSGFSATFRSMEVNDSFECDFTPGRRQGMYIVAQRQGIKIAIRVTGDKMRVWRVE